MLCIIKAQRETPYRKYEKGDKLIRYEKNAFLTRAVSYNICPSAIP